MNQVYRSETARAGAIFLYFKFSWFVSLVTYGLFLAVCAYAHIVTVPMVLFLIACQNITWLVGGFCMLAAYKSLEQTPPPPREKTPEKIELIERIIPVYTSRKVGEGDKHESTY